MSCFSPRRMLCAAAAAMLLISPTPVQAESMPTDALLPVQSAWEALCDRATQWFRQLRPDTGADDARMLVPGGQNIGVALMCEGVLVVGTSDPGTQEAPRGRRASVPVM